MQNRPSPFDTYPPTKLWWNNQAGYTASYKVENAAYLLWCNGSSTNPRNACIRVEANGSYKSGYVVRMFNYTVISTKALEIYEYLVHAVFPDVEIKKYEKFEPMKGKLDDDINPDHRGQYCCACTVKDHNEFCPSRLAQDTVSRLFTMRDNMRVKGSYIWDS